MADREATRRQWLGEVLDASARVEPLAGDASFRRYYRVHHRNTSYVLMDAPPDKEDTGAFLDVRRWLDEAGVRVPNLHACCPTEGWLLLEDFGDCTWSAAREGGQSLKPLFEDALRQLLLLQAAKPHGRLPEFDLARMRRECDLYLDWYLPQVAGYHPSERERASFHRAIEPWLQKLAAMPRVPVHLDFHSRNLMLPDGGVPLGVIDFQDAIWGAPTYDLASLLYDCYQDYSESVRRQWSHGFFDLLPQDVRKAFESFGDWQRMLRLSAWQRHIKAIGIFSRLAHRDGKRQFLSEIPLTRKHLLEEMEFLGLRAVEHPLLYLPPAADALVVPG